MPDTFSPSCLNVSWTVLAPWGDSIVTSQSPVMLVCANAGAGREQRNGERQERETDYQPSHIYRLLKE